MREKLKNVSPGITERNYIFGHILQEQYEKSVSSIYATGWKLKNRSLQNTKKNKINKHSF